MAFNSLFNSDKKVKDFESISPVSADTRPNISSYNSEPEPSVPLFDSSEESTESVMDTPSSIVFGDSENSEASDFQAPVFGGEENPSLDFTAPVFGTGEENISSGFEAPVFESSEDSSASGFEAPVFGSSVEEENKEDQDQDQVENDPSRFAPLTDMLGMFNSGVEDTEEQSSEFNAPDVSETESTQDSSFKSPNAEVDSFEVPQFESEQTPVFSAPSEFEEEQVSENPDVTEPEVEQTPVFSEPTESEAKQESKALESMDSEDISTEIESSSVEEQKKAEEVEETFEQIAPPFTPIAIDISENPKFKSWGLMCEFTSFIGATELLLTYLVSMEQKYGVTCPVSACGVNANLFDHIEFVGESEFGHKFVPVQVGETEDDVQWYEVVDADGERYLSCISTSLDPNYLESVISAANIALQDNGEFIYYLVGSRLLSDKDGGESKLINTLKLNTYEMSSLVACMSQIPDIKISYEIINKRQSIRFKL